VTDGVERYVGLMSGTSLDGVDGVLVAFAGGVLRVEAHAFTPFAPGLRAELLALNTSGHDELHRAALAGNAWRGFTPTSFTRCWNGRGEARPPSWPSAPMARPCAIDPAPLTGPDTPCS